MYNKYIYTIIYIFILEFIWIYLINSNNYVFITEVIQKKNLN